MQKSTLNVYNEKMSIWEKRESSQKIEPRIYEYGFLLE